MEMIDDSKFTYEKDWTEIYQLLEFAEAEREKHKKLIHDKNTSMKEKAKHMRDYKGLQGVCYSLRWVMGDPQISLNKVLGRE